MTSIILPNSLKVQRVEDKRYEVVPVSVVPKVRLFFEWGGGVLWCGNEAALQRFDVGPVEDKLPLSNETLNRLHAMTVWHDTALDWNNPPGPSPWSGAEDESFTEAVARLTDDIRHELGPDYEIVNEHRPIY
ncbi:hypothetical protein [Sinorhizobium fredii]|uniref:hypothetical protein n=1 Tax=Rhizobium fredii TaxID=380 RepID=UPI0035130900